MRGTLPILIGAAALLGATPAGAAEVRLAVVASANNGLASEEPLRFADEEGVRVSEMLVEIGGFAPGAVEVVPSATPDRVAEALGRAVLAAAAARQAGDDVMLLVYYTGHAGSDGLHLNTEVLTLEALKTAARVVPADERVFVLDACQSGQMFRSMGASLVDVRADDVPFIPPPNEVWITSSGPEEQSFEVDGRRGALFTHFFVSGTRGAADTDADGKVTLGEVFDFVSAQASAAAAGLGQVQRPQWGGTLEGLVLGNIDGARSGIDVLGPLGEPLLVVDLQDERVLAEIPAGVQGRMALPPGRYQLVSLPSKARPRVAETTIKSDEFELVDVSTRLASVAGVRTQGGVLVRHPWTLGAAYQIAAGQTPGSPAAQGATVEIRRELGRGHSAAFALGVLGAPFTSEFVEGRSVSTSGLASWTWQAPVGRARVGPMLGLGGGWLRQDASRTAHPQWGTWYGTDDGGQVANFALGTAVLGLRVGVPFGAWSVDMIPSGGLQAVFAGPTVVQPVASLRLGVTFGL